MTIITVNNIRWHRAAMEAAPEPLPVPGTPGDPNVGSGDLTVGVSIVGSVVPITPRVLSGITISGGGFVPMIS